MCWNERAGGRETTMRNGRIQGLAFREKVYYTKSTKGFRYQR